VRKLTLPIVLIWLLLFPASLALAQDPLETATPETAEETEAPAQVDVQPVAQDEQIDERLTSILEATEWFTAPAVEARDGVVFLDGQTDTEAHREWAGNLARNTQDVVAVVNRIEVIPRPAWDFSPAWAEIRALWRGAVQSLPLILFAVVVLFLTWWLARSIARLSQRLLAGRLESPLLTRIAAQTIAVPIFLLGLYLVLQVAGLTRLAVTLLGTTGVVGIVIGFAFRDIAENFLASILLSLRKPFRTEDLIEVAGYTGIVQQMNVRSTVLMTLEGNHVQIPNATVFKNTIINYSANPNRRSDFSIGIGYEDSIRQAQELVAQLLADHPAVLKSPEPLVLVDRLGAATVDIRVYFWYDATLYAPIKIKSSLMRLTKRAFEEAGISMPDEAREVIFPRGVPVLQPVPPETAPDGQERVTAPPPVTGVVPPEPVSTGTEGNLSSEDQEIYQQAKQSRIPEEGENLLRG
jgi:small-conductance mechanosensitive channel